MYPGSSKGPNPEDDPENFSDWLYDNMPESTKNHYMNLIEKEKKKRPQHEATEHIDLSLAHIMETDVPNDEMILTLPEKEFVAQTHGITAYHSKINTEEGEISPFPENMQTDYQAAQDIIEKWAIFRIYPTLNIWTKQAAQTLEDIRLGRIPEGRTRTPSLFRYYNLLPEICRTHPIIINLVRCLEFSKHEMSLKQKEIALNYACQFVVPMDPSNKNF